ncbi:hypothetical protein [uncultured Stenotrophomonas sp.]|uniref:hypothetical protein n=1 Tax=uncultured Stenotrophomonas sp. TaxID=165438 RepID=UPI0025D37926|nr:hypothetical protein [uncultured Stenotrophomonas sp.]
MKEVPKVAVPWLLVLLGLPFAVQATPRALDADDPIAHSCYFCTADEMRQTALGLGNGVHYVYDIDLPYITGYTVETSSGTPVATRFDAEDWVERQFLSLVEHYRPGEGVEQTLLDVKLYAPGSDHGLRAGEGQFIKGHHLSALHPRQSEANETVLRFLQRHGGFGFLDTSDSDGRLLQLQVIRERGYPVAALLAFEHNWAIHAIYHFDYASRRWSFVEAYDIDSSRIQHSAADFVRYEFGSRYEYSSFDRWFADAFAERAGWAGVPLIGTMPPPSSYKNITFTCTQPTGTPECAISAK